MSVAAGVGKKTVKIANGIVNFVVLVVILLLVAFCCYALWDADQVYNAADPAQYEVYKPSVDNGGPGFGELQALNSEVFSWLTVYGTNIDYPVAQAADNMKYINYNAQGDYSLTGSIFLDCGNKNDYSDFNSILYGHHMEKQAMFGEIGNFSDKEYFDARQYGNLYYNQKDHGLEFFAFLHVDAYDFSVFTAGIQGTNEQQAYIDNLLGKAMYSRDIGVTAEDRIVLLSTCSSESTNGRDILVARITDALFNDTFQPTETSETGIQAFVDAQSGVWAALPFWGKVLLILLPAVLLITLLIVVIYKKAQKRKRLQQMMRKHRENILHSRHHDKQAQENGSADKE